MLTTLDELMQQLASEDSDTRSSAIAALIGWGSMATPVLTRALKHPQTRVRVLAAEGLSRIADPASADALVGALEDSHDRVRARAATALANMRDPRALDALIRTIEDFADELHGQFSLSAYTLMSYGPEALPAVAPLLKSPNQMTRTKAIWIIRENVTPLLGAQGDWEQLWESLGRYDPEAPEDARNHAADLWASWVRSHVTGAQTP